VEVFPNPAGEGPVTVAYALNSVLSADLASCEVYNALGQLVERRALNNPTGTLTLSDSWPAGVYQVVLRNGSQSQTVTLLRK
jgi:hypothetical protein